MKVKVLFAPVCLVTLFACSGGGNARSEESLSELAQQIWTQMSQAESGADVYSEELNPALLSKHNNAIRLIQSKIPQGYPEPYLPFGELNNRKLDPGLSRSPEMTESVIALGEKLFSEKLLSFSSFHGFSRTHGVSCTSCHIADQELTDGKALSLGIEGDLTHRNTPTLWNAAYYSSLTWFNPNFPILEMQAKIPLFNNDPIEMGLRGKEKDVLEELAKDTDYQKAVKSAFNLDLSQGVSDGSVDYTIITHSIAAYERTLIRFDGKWDRFLQGQAQLSAEEQMGARLFYGQVELESGGKLACSSCHQGIMMTDSFQYVRDGRFYSRSVFHNEIRTPNLRFVAKTAPYFHDGSVTSLEELLRFYEAGNRKGPQQGPFVLSESDKAALLAFLKIL